MKIEGRFAAIVDNFVNGNRQDAYEMAKRLTKYQFGVMLLWWMTSNQANEFLKMYHDKSHTR